MSSRANQKQLQARWMALLHPFAVGERLAEEVFADLAARYGEDGRYYHTLNHIQRVLAAVESMKAQAQNLAAIQLAAWFHDVVYDVHATDNEERSAEYAGRMLKRMGIDDETITAVTRLILATQTHQAAAGDIDCQILLDADLATLAAAPQLYDQYARAIRQEYAFVPEPTYRHGRVQFLQQFLGRERVFLTGQMFAAREQRARQNIAREIASLK